MDFFRMPSRPLPERPQQEPLITIRAAFDRVLHDVRATGWSTTCLVKGPDPEGRYLVGNGTLVAFCAGDDAEQFVAELADELSEDVSESMAAGGNLHLAQIWPPCPAHDHSLNPGVENGKAVWRCRDDSAIRFAIGALPGPQAHHR